MDDLISVIVPVYNVEKYLDQCMQTIVNQTYNNLEIIIVDDGSTDNSLLICEKWKKLDNRIIIYHKENNGLGNARNSGLEIATGKYVVFVDSDDFLDLSMIYILYNNISNCDTVLCGHSVYYNDNKIELKQGKDNEIYENNAIINQFIPELMGTNPEEKNDIGISVSVWHGLYSLKIIKENNIRFPSEREFISEDMIFDIDYFSKCQKVKLIKDCLYFYRKGNESSLTTKYNPLRFKKEIELYNELYRKLSKITSIEYFEYRLKRTFLGRVRSCLKRAVQYKKNVYNEIMEICNNDKVQEVLNVYPYKKNPFFLRCFNFSIKYKLISVIIFMIKIKYRNKE